MPWISKSEYDQLIKHSSINVYLNKLNSTISNAARSINEGLADTNCILSEGAEELKGIRLALEGIKFMQMPAPGLLTFKVYKQMEEEGMVKFLVELSLLEANSAKDWAKRVVTVDVAGVRVFENDLGIGEDAVGTLRDPAIVGVAGDSVFATLVDFDSAGNATPATVAEGVIVDTIAPPLALGTFGFRTYEQIDEPTPEPTPEV